jgi:hypothetical protein
VLAGKIGGPVGGVGLDGHVLGRGLGAAAVAGGGGGVDDGLTALLPGALNGLCM